MRQKSPFLRNPSLGGVESLSEVSKRGWRTEGVGARKSLPYRRFRPFFGPFSCAPLMSRRTQLWGTILAVFCSSLPPSLFAAKTWPHRGRPELIAAHVLLFFFSARAGSPHCFSVFSFLFPSLFPFFLSFSFFLLFFFFSLSLLRASIRLYDL